MKQCFILPLSLLHITNLPDRFLRSAGRFRKIGARICLNRCWKGIRDGSISIMSTTVLYETGS